MARGVQSVKHIFTSYIYPTHACVNRESCDWDWYPFMYVYMDVYIYVTVPGKRDQFGIFFKIELLLPHGRVGFELQNALHI